MTRILSAPSLAAQPLALQAGPHRFDAVTEQVIERTAADAYERGRADAVREAAAAADRAARQLALAVAGALEQVAGHLVEHREARSRADIDLALVIAEAVLRRAPLPDEVELAAMVRAAVDHLDETRVAVHVHPSSRTALVEALGTVGGTVEIDVVADPSVAAGQATVGGRWGRAEVSREHAVAAVRAALEEARDD